jgi:hypothetical protein
MKLTEPAEHVGNCTDSAELVGNCTDSAELVMNWTKPAEDVREKFTKPIKHVIKFTETSECVKKLPLFRK